MGWMSYKGGLFFVLLLANVLSSFGQDVTRVVLEIKAAPKTIDQSQKESIEKKLKLSLEKAKKASVVQPETILEWEKLFNPAKIGTISPQYYFNRLLMARVCVVTVVILENSTRQTRESISAYGISETIVHTQSAASMIVEIKEYFTNKVLLSRNLSESGQGKNKALDSCMDRAATILKECDYSGGQSRGDSLRGEVADL